MLSVYSQRRWHENIGPNYYLVMPLNIINRSTNTTVARMRTNEKREEWAKQTHKHSYERRERCDRHRKPFSLATLVWPEPSGTNHWDIRIEVISLGRARPASSRTHSCPVSTRAHRTHIRTRHALSCHVCWSVRLSRLVPIGSVRFFSYWVDVCVCVCVQVWPRHNSMWLYWTQTYTKTEVVS